MRFLGIGTIVALLLLAVLPTAAAAAPTCAEGPETVGDTIVGTPCADTIGPPPRSVTRVFGEGGDDVVFGGRGNDRLNGGEGNDRLYGGIGDDQLRGGNGDDRLSGGFGADSVLDGEAGNDFVRGDATIDDIQNSGGGTDTLSYATGVTPGFFDRPNPPYSFPDFSAYDDFPQTPEGRGAYVNLQTGRGDNGRAPDGGGFDEGIDSAGFEIVIGSAFSDYIVGTSAAQTIYGGGGADVILGGGGADQLHGGAEGDSCAGAGATIDCETSEEDVDPRDPGVIAVGLMSPGSGPSALYLTGSNQNDVVAATYAGGAVTFTLGPGSQGAFDAGLAVTGGCAPPAGGQVVCPAADGPDSIVLAGLDGEDALTAAGFPATASVIVLGGTGNDGLTGGDTEDAVVDGDGDDTVNAGAGDDAVPNNEGDDSLHAGAGEDLFVSDSVCEGDLLDGGPDRDNANWANFDLPITIDMGARLAGRTSGEGQLTCAGEGPPTSLEAIEDTEGTNLADTMIGDAGPNQLLGRRGADSYFAGAGNDSILANSAVPANPGDTDPAIDCGEGWDTALIDIPTAWTQDAAPVDCEDVEERPPNSFRPPGTPPDPNPPPPVPPSVEPVGPSPPEPVGSPPVPGPQRPARPDVKEPQTRILHRPPRLAGTARRTRRVAFRFTAGERGVRFRCRLDGRRFRPCSSPRIYRVRTGRHAIRIYAIDAAGNRDLTPARFAFRVLRRR